MMFTSLTTLSRPWPSGDSWVVGELQIDQETFEILSGIEFQTVDDDLDALALATLEDPKVGPLWLVHYRGSPSPWLEVWADSKVGRDAARAAVQNQIGEDVSWHWVNPSESNPVRSAGSD